MDDDIIFEFDGNDFSEILLDSYEGWVNLDGVNGYYLWYFGHENLINSIIGTQVEVPTSNPVLSLTTYWDIETYWDFDSV